MKVYLDNCCFNRPFDDQSDLRIRLEAESKLAVQSLIQQKRLDMLWSFVLEYETQNNPFKHRKEFSLSWARLASIFIEPSDAIEKNADAYAEKGIKLLDSFHLAAASAGGADFFLTTDKGILKKAPEISKPMIRNPVDFILGWEEGL